MKRTLVVAVALALSLGSCSGGSHVVTVTNPCSDPADWETVSGPGAGWDQMTWDQLRAVLDNAATAWTDTTESIGSAASQMDSDIQNLDTCGG